MQLGTLFAQAAERAVVTRSVRWRPAPLREQCPRVPDAMTIQPGTPLACNSVLVPALTRLKSMPWIYHRRVAPGLRHLGRRLCVRWALVASI